MDPNFLMNIEPITKQYRHHYDNRRFIRYVLNKHIEFVNGPLENKSVRHLPGIEETLSERLIECGYRYASQIMDKYLALKKNKSHFMYWMTEICGAGPQESSDCFYALEEWIETNLWKE